MSTSSEHPRRSAVPAASGGPDLGTAHQLCVLLVDGHQLVGAALCTALRDEGHDAHQLPTAGRDTILTAAAAHPGGLVLVAPALGVDGRGRRIRAPELVAALRGRGHRVLALGAHLDDPAIGEMIAAGALGVVPKSAPFDTLLGILAAAAAGRPVMTAADRARWLDRAHRHRQHVQERAGRLQRLTPRELQVLQLMATGHRATAIAEHFVTALPTVRTQIRSVLTKLEVGSQLEAVALLHDTAVDPAAGNGRARPPGSAPDAPQVPGVCG